MTATKAPPSQGTGTARLNRSYVVGGAVVPVAPLSPGLYIVATPIGNLGDVTLRALANPGRSRLDSRPRTLAYRERCSRVTGSRRRSRPPEHNAAEARPRALRRIAAGQAVALISDAGTPLISDPGYRLVAEAVAQGLAVIAAPGPSAALAALCVAALPTDRFFFEGFLPPKRAARRERINALAAVPGTLVFYESPGRVARRLPTSRSSLGGPAAVARELTKLHVDVRRGTLDKLAEEYADEEASRGEIVIVVGAGERRPPIADDALDREIAELLAKLSVKDAAAAVAAKHGLPRRQVYARALALAGADR